MSDLNTWNTAEKKARDEHRSDCRLAGVKALNIISELDKLIEVWDGWVTTDDDLYLGSLFSEVAFLKALLVDLDDHRDALESRLK
ncbi:MAG: hypothetical protein KHY46_12370 [Clostridiales bacterium]|nr:hypothetical protein [Clostridiales bacterium]